MKQKRVKIPAKSVFKRPQPLKKLNKHFGLEEAARMLEGIKLRFYVNIFFGPEIKWAKNTYPLKCQIDMGIAHKNSSS